MKNFDQEREERRPRLPVEERSFVIGGEPFVARDRFRPDVMTHLESLPTRTTDRTTCSCTHRVHEHPRFAACNVEGCDCVKFDAAVTNPGPTLAQQLEAFDETILGMIEDGNDGHGRWRRLRAREDDPVTVEDMMALVQWMTENDTGRPTGAPNGYSGGRESTGTPSTDGYSSPDTPAALTASTSGSL